MDGCVDVSLGVDALVKIVDNYGQDMGQAYINLNPYLEPDKLDVPHHIQVETSSTDLTLWQVPISSGGQYRGTLTGTLKVRCLHDQLFLG